jgi:hypothetical protein
LCVGLTFSGGGVGFGGTLDAIMNFRLLVGRDFIGQLLNNDQLVRRTLLEFVNRPFPDSRLGEGPFTELFYLGWNDNDTEIFPVTLEVLKHLEGHSVLILKVPLGAMIIS